MSEVKYNHDEMYATRVVSIYTEANPNPNSMKFMLNFLLMPEGKTADYTSVEEAENSVLAQELLGYAYIKRVFYMTNFITLTKDDSVEWIEVIPALKQHIKTYFEDKRTLFKEAPAEAQQYLTEDSETVKKIKGILDEYIRPAVETDGGAIQFSSFDEANGVLKVLLQGSCSGCPSSTVTLKQGIQNLMVRMVPQVKDVVAEGV
jgi:Fe-S cluster biogenesis protein NfuA